MAEYDVHAGGIGYYEIPPSACVCDGDGDGDGGAGGGGSGAIVGTPSLALPSNGTSALGVDIDVLSDLPVGFTLAAGAKNLANALLRRITTPERFLADSFGDDPDYGWDCRRLLNRALSTAELHAELAKCERQVLNDERVQAVQARHELSGSHSERTVTLELDITTTEGALRLTVAIDDVTTALLSVDTLV